MNRKIILAVAPTGGWGSGDNNPITPDAIARDVIACAEAGAAVVHMHARNAKGELTTDLTPFSTTVAAIKDSCDIILEASTGGLSNLTAAERVLPASAPHAEMGSLNIGSLNFGDAVYRNSLPDVRFWIDAMARRGVKPSLEIFDTGHLETALHLIQEGFVAPPCNFSFIFNVRWGMPYDPALLAYLKSRLPSGSRWGALLIHSRDFSNHIGAAKAGASVLRVGFEDSFNYNGKIATANAELVTALRAELEAAGFSIASVQEARALLLG
jgi:3-keto-5-aminohexanoate cleavage enzyme